MRKALLFLLLLPAASLRAEGPLTWDDAVREASLNNPALRGARAAVRAAEDQVGGAWSPFLPQASLDAGYDRNKAGRSVSQGVSAHQNIFNGFGDAASLSRARADLDDARAGLDDALARAGADLRTAFSRLLFAQEQSTLASAISKRRHEDLRMVNLRFQAGQENKGSVLRTKAADGQATYEEAQATRELRVAQRQLARAMGRDPFQILLATGSLGAELPGQAPDFRALAQEVPAVRQANARLRSSKAGVVQARSGFLPSLDADGRAGRSGTHWPPDRKNDWAANLSLSWPFFSGGRTFFDTAAARAQEEGARAAVADAVSQAAFTLEDAYASLQNGVEKVGVQKDFLEAAAVRAEIARAQYNNGLLSFQDWDVIENDLITSQKALLASRRDAASALAAWEKARGKGDLTP